MEIGFDLEKSNPSLFHEIIVSASMFVDHMPHTYEHALQCMSEEYAILKKESTDSLSQLEPNTDDNSNDSNNNNNIKDKTV